jgi:predicted TIM-barrel fold metal-dependent hydrolase
MPYSPDVADRETIDDGFSKGLGFFFQPSEEYWFDSHTHLRSIRSETDLVGLLDEWFARLDAFRLGKVMAIAKDPQAFPIYKEVSGRDPRFAWMFWLDPDNPDATLLGEAFECNAAGLKLHNSPIMRGQYPVDIWLSDAWSRIFSMMEESGKPILWHVTQRKSTSPYHGGGLNSYWEEGSKRGVTATNEDLLQVTLRLLRDFPGLKIQGAHQLHVGLDHLSVLFDEFENLYVDTSCSWFVRWADVLYEHDRQVLRDFVLRYPDRILLGSDAPLAPGAIDEYLVQGFLCHTRCINQLRLPYDVLQKVAHGNAERLYGTDPLSPVRRGNYRP